jgi:hypothetical protein
LLSLVLKENKAPKAKEENVESKALKVSVAIKDYQVPKVFVVKQENVENKDRKVSLV